MKRLIRIWLLTCSVPFLLFSGDRSNSRGMGMARTLNAGSRGYEALGLNPANLALRDRGSFMLGIAPLGVAMGSDFIAYDVYRDYFTGVPTDTGGRAPRYLSNSDKQDLLDRIGSRTLATTFADLEVTWVGVSLALPRLGGIGFAITDHVGMNVDLPKDYVKMLLFGLDSTGSRYVFDDTNVSAWFWREYSFGYGGRVPIKLRFPEQLYAGVSVKILRGYGVFETARYKSSIANAPEPNSQTRAELDFDFLFRRSGIALLDSVFQDKETPPFSAFPDPAGKGVGFDLGFTGIWHGMFFSASLTDLGSITWNQNIVETYGSYALSVTDPTSQQGKDSIETAIRGKNRPGGSFSTSLPTKLRFGTAFYADSVRFLHWLPGRMLLAFDYTQGLNSSLGNSTTPRLSLGMEYRLIPLLPLRTGISLGGGTGFRWAAGFGLDLHAVTLDVGTENIAVLFAPNSFDMFSFALNLRMRI